MKTVDEIRRENLAVLIKRDFSNALGLGGQTALANHLNRSASQVGQWVRGAPHPITGKPKGISDDTARMIEERCNLSRGWLDQDHSSSQSGAPHSAVVVLPAQERDSTTSLKIIDSAADQMGVHIPHEKRMIAGMLAEVIDGRAGNDLLEALAPMLVQLATPPPDAPANDEERLVLTAFRSTTGAAREVFMIQARHANRKVAS